MKYFKKNKNILIFTGIILIIMFFTYLFVKKNIENFISTPSPNNFISTPSPNICKSEQVKFRDGTCSCPFNQGIKDGICKKCPHNEGILEDNTCGTCPPEKGILRTDGRCNNCLSDEGILDNGTCGKCPTGKGILLSEQEYGKCGKCPVNQGILDDGTCGKCPENQGIFEDGICGIFPGAHAIIDSKTGLWKCIDKNMIMVTDEKMRKIKDSNKQFSCVCNKGYKFSISRNKDNKINVQCDQKKK